MNNYTGQYENNILVRKSTGASRATPSRAHADTLSLNIIGNGFGFVVPSFSQMFTRRLRRSKTYLRRVEEGGLSWFKYSSLTNNNKKTRFYNSKYKYKIIFSSQFYRSIKLPTTESGITHWVASFVEHILSFCNTYLIFLSCRWIQIVYYL